MMRHPEGHLEDERWRDGEREVGSRGSSGSVTERTATVTGPRLTARGWLRWGWRQLTSMRVALMLLMLLAVAALPGSMLPQRPHDPDKVAQYLLDHPTAGAWLDRFGFFDVFTSVWFSAIYLLLFISLVGCILPRAVHHLGTLRARPPRAPRSFERFPEQVEFTSTRTPAEIAEAARVELGRRHRVDVVEEGDGFAVSAERGYLREAGNIVFHLALVGLLVSVALGHLLSYRGQAIIVEGDGLANSVVDYDTFESGAWFDPDSLVPSSVVLDSFSARFNEDAEARDFRAELTVRDPDGSATAETLKVNEPLSLGGAKMYLSGNGYAPQVTVRDGDGAIVFAGAVPFLPQDGVYTSRGVIKVPDAPVQLGFAGYLLPTAVTDGDVTRSVYPQPINPMLVLTAYQGDLGLDEGVPQNVYQLDLTRMTQITGTDGPSTLYLQPGQRVDLPDGLGSITFDALPRFVSVDVRYDPATTWILVFALAALAGLVASLFVPRRRLWVRARPADVTNASAAGGSGSTNAADGPAPRPTVVAVAGLSRGEDGGLRGAVRHLGERLRPPDTAAPEPSASPGPPGGSEE